MKTAYLGLGSNIGNRQEHLRRAVAQFATADLQARRCSPLYETEPVDYLDQPWFLNQVVEVETTLFPMQLLARIGRIEHKLGRVRTLAKGPRTIDIDILFYGGSVIQTEQLTIPHARLAERRFVLAPLADLNPDLRHPVTRATVKEMLDAAPHQKLRRL